MGVPRFRRWLGGGLLVAVLVCAGCYGKAAFLLCRAWLNDRPVLEELPPGYVDDMSRLNQTHVAEVWNVPSDPVEAERQLQDLLRRARRDHLRVSIAGARHSMGGHTIYPEGIYVNMLPFKGMQLVGRHLLRVGSGARWADVIPYLDARGLSVAIMQATHNFSVGGSVSVNCHGWQHDRPPIASSVEAFRLLQADGQVVRCSRDDNAELFRLALGGYGLFGVILDVDLRVVPNAAYVPEPPLLAPTRDYVRSFRARVRQHGDVTMAIGRLNVNPDAKVFLRDAVITLFRPTARPIPTLKSPGFAALRRTVLLAEVGSDAGKKLRWDLEIMGARKMAGRVFSRNQLLNEDAELYQERKAERTEILHEYFIPPDGFEEFLEKMRVAVPRHKGDLLHVTVRDVRKDTDVWLNYADKDVFAFVLMFSQARTEDGNRRMEALSRELIDAALACGGTYYLPYRLHATAEQFHKAYPNARAFFARKRHFDPDELFQNQFYLRSR